MSTFFRSAAMSLLSRTLQTLLSKYLSDVDVEGVDLPSLYSSDGHSGWGVRLSNVKLREGAKLLDLPGRPKQRRKKRRRVVTDTDESRVDHVTENSGGERTPMEPPGDSPGKARRRQVGTDSKDDNFTVDEQANTDSVPEGPPPVPEAPRRSSWFFWSSSSSTVEQTEETDSSIAAEKDELNPLEGYLGDSQQRLDLETASQHDDEQEKPTARVQEDERPVQYEEYEEEEEDDIPMILRLGKGGTVGTLDVRLVGKDIHVFVEDADLTVEAVRLAPDVEPEDEHDAEADGKKKKKKTKKVPPEIKTVGDRILAENAIARAISLIPNLFLRDIRIRVVVRDEIVTKEDDGEYTVDDSIVELSVELLSVTDGEDFLARFRTDEDDLSSGEDSDGEEDGERPPILLNPNGTNVIDDSDYMTKRIRTGRGADGGIVIRVFAPSKALGSFDTRANHQWARAKYIEASEYCLLRCPGLDIQARVFMGTKKERDATDMWYSDDYEEYTVDAMLFGIDYVVPGPKPPLPPMEPQDVGPEDKIWTYEGATNFQVDDNGIRSSGVDSSFHRVARGMTPRACDGEHLPCEYCRRCWQAPPCSQSHHPLDAATPMGGLVLNISMRDPLEINVDRTSLDVLGLLLRLFKTPPGSPEDLPDGFTERHVSFGLDGSERSNTSALSRTSRPSSDHLVQEVPNTHDANVNDDLSSNSSLGSRKVSDTSKELPAFERTQSGFSLDSKSVAGDPPLVPGEAPDISESFPSYMQPENIQFLGLHLPEIRIRVHVMKCHDAHDMGGSFFFWDVSTKCMTMDHQTLKATEKAFQDIRLDLGHLQLREYKGMDRRLLASIGLRQRIVEFDEVTVETLLTEAGENMRPPWPSTAAALLDVQPPLDTLAYESRDRHAFQMRFVSVTDPESDRTPNTSLIDVRLGPMSVDMPWEIKTLIFDVIDTAKVAVLGEPRQIDSVLEPVELSSPPKTLMKYKVRLDGGQIKLDPLLDVQMPLTTLSGEKSSESGIFFESLLEHVSLCYGKPSRPTISSARQLSLRGLADLPENVRLRILLFLKDLKPLELALGVKSEADSFLRCRAVNKQIVKVGRSSSRYSFRSNPTSSDDDDSKDNVSRREEVLTNLMKLDDDALEDLYLQHQRNQRKLARKAGR